MDWSQLTPLASPPDADAPALARVQAVVSAEAARPLLRTWRGDLRALVLASAGLCLALALVTRFTVGWAVPSIHARIATLGLLVFTQLVGASAAIAPRARALQLGAFALAAATMFALVGLRREGNSDASAPLLVCTLSHVALALLPLVVGLRRLRRAAITPSRALSVGVTAGTVGALLGELECGQSATHVAMYHVPAWVVVISASLLLSRRLRAETHAP